MPHTSDANPHDPLLIPTPFRTIGSRSNTRAEHRPFQHPRRSWRVVSAGGPGELRGSDGWVMGDPTLLYQSKDPKSKQ